MRVSFTYYMKTAVITGASGAIGFATVQQYLANGYFVIAQYNKNESGAQALKEWANNNSYGDFLFTAKADFSNEQEVAEFAQMVVKSFKRINVLVNNAGVDHYNLLTDTTTQEWDKIFNVNVKSAFILTRELLGGMIQAKHGNVVFVSSIWGKSGASMECAYSASKSALIGLTKSLAKEVAPSGIRVNCVCPGVINSDMNARFSKEEISELIDRTPLGRIGNPNDVAQLIYFLTGDGASFITGETITVDGGFTLSS